MLAVKIFSSRPEKTRGGVPESRLNDSLGEE